jgi:DNA/RNA endonuclease YhcR with UshA esterase domain
MRQRIILTVLLSFAGAALSSPSPLLARQEPPKDEPPATQPTSQPVLVMVNDKAAVDAALDKDVILDGTIDSAAWSSSGKVMRIEFKDTAESKVQAVIFEKKRADFDAAFAGDVAKALGGKHVRINGRLKDYKGKPEIVIDQVHQITIVDAP